VIFGHQWPNNFGRGDKNHSEFGLQIAKYLKDAPKPNPPIIGFPQDFPPVRRYTGGCEYVTIPTMHERAILTSTHASLGLAGDLVFIASLGDCRIFGIVGHPADELCVIESASSLGESVDESLRAR
jgi:hypothetical protein